MLFVLLSVAVLAIVLSIILAKLRFDFAASVLAMCGALAGAICGITIGVTCICLVDAPVIDAKIEMYQEENQVIEGDMDRLVKDYMEYEQGTVFMASGDSYMSLVTLYPDLKADILVQEQIRVYNENNQKIKELKERKLDISVYRWWLYFGK